MLALLLLSCAARERPAPSVDLSPGARWAELSWTPTEAYMPLNVEGMVRAADAARQLLALAALPAEAGVEVVLGRSTQAWDGGRCMPLALSAEGLGRCRAVPLEAGPSSPVWLYTPGAQEAVLPLFGGSSRELTLVCHDSLPIAKDGADSYRVALTQGGSARWETPHACPNTPAVKLARAKSGAAWVRWAGLDADVPLPGVRALKEAPPSERLRDPPERLWRAYQGTDADGRAFSGFHDELSGARVALPADMRAPPYRFDLDGTGVFELVHRPGAGGDWVASFDGDEDGVIDSCWSDWKTAYADDLRGTVQTFPARITLAVDGRCLPEAAPQP
ncbi:MAG: hypothetical protein H6741_01255 [Alphaproteobacteria bacterium]|nr:hypothetical protein [Alphaproteobacteria bacterium]